MEDLLRQHLATLVAAFEGVTGAKASSVSRRAVNDARFVDKVLAGEGFTVRTYDKVVQWLSDNWPDTAWPTDVPRPTAKAAQPSDPATATDPAAADTDDSEIAGEVPTSLGCPRNNGLRPGSTGSQSR